MGPNISSKGNHMGQVIIIIGEHIINTIISIIISGFIYYYNILFFYYQVHLLLKSLY
jgi:hypothetical protein